MQPEEEECDFSTVSQPPQFSTSSPLQATGGNKVSLLSAKSNIAPTSHRKLVERKDLIQDSIALKIQYPFAQNPSQHKCRTILKQTSVSILSPNFLVSMQVL
jgi:hypothetical protein